MEPFADAAVIFAKFWSGKSITVDVEASETTGGAKAKIQDIKGHPDRSSALIFAGKQFEGYQHGRRLHHREG